MDTFLIFLFVFGLFGWCIHKLLIFTSDTVGSNSPLKVIRVYQISAWSYFTKFDNLFIYYLLPVAGFMFYLGLNAVFHPDVNYPLAARIGIFGVSLLMLAIPIQYLILDINHWAYTENVTIRSNPGQHEIDIRFDDQTITLRNGDIERIEMFSNNSKIRISYHTYHLQNGDHFILSDRMPGAWIIREYFKKVPVEYYTKRFPYIK